MKKEVTVDVLARSFGTEVSDIDDECRHLLEAMDSGYRVLEGEEKNELIFEVFKRIDQDKQVIAAPERTATWFNGWQENLNDFRDNNYALDALLPRFIRKGQVMRFMGDYIAPNEGYFEHLYFNIFRTWLFKKYFTDYDVIYDVGCGSCYNLAPLCQRFPDKMVYGLDFVQSSIDIVNELAKSHNYNTKGLLFNLIEPDFSLSLAESSVVFTSGCIEQLASQFELFLEFLLEKRPSLVVNIEPTVEVYNRDNLFDFLAAKFHEKRGYTQGYLPALQELEKQGKVEIIKSQRLNFGSLFIEGYVCTIWRPVG